MRGVNKVILVGHIGSNPEYTHTAAGMPVANFSLATSDKHKNTQTGEVKEYTEWHSIRAFSHVADFVGKYLKSGAKVYIEGKLRTEQYTDKNNIERKITKVIANEVQGLNDKKQQGDVDGNIATSHQNFDDDVPF
jgi:single-strand DNA-binding protein